MTEPEKRQEFIKKHLAVYGWINKTPILANFDVGSGTARDDLQEYVNKNGAGLSYNLSARRYEVVK